MGGGVRRRGHPLAVSVNRDERISAIRPRILLPSSVFQSAEITAHLVLELVGCAVAHQSPIRIKAVRALRCVAPGCVAAPENPLFPTVSNRRGPTCRPHRSVASHADRRSNPLWLTVRAQRTLDTLGGIGARRAISSHGSANPQMRHCRGRPIDRLDSSGYPKALRRLERLAVLHHVVARARQLVRHRLDGHHRQAAGALLLVPALDRRVVAHREVRRLDEGPGQVLVAALGVALALLLAVGFAPAVHRARVGGEVARAGEAARCRRSPARWSAPASRRCR